MAVFTFDKANSKNYKKRGDYGIRVARPGYDAENCAQNQLIFNSNWPILQITKVIDLGDGRPNEGPDAEWDPIIYDYDKIYWDLTNHRWTDTLPSGLQSLGYWSINRVSVNKTHLIYSAGAKIFGEYENNRYVRKFIEFNYLRFYHGLGYPPFYLDSHEVSDLDRKVILTSIDVSKDVDYPYTEGPLPIIKTAKDYGISSSSIFGRKVPGLSSNMFSKLVQCVKTEETCKWEVTSDDVTDKILCWSPFSKGDEIKAGEVTKFEAYTYSAFKNPFFISGQVDDFLSMDENMNSDPFNENHLYYDRDLVVYMLAMEESSSFGNAVAYTNFSTAASYKDDASMVILRSPMVSPEYEEITI